MSNKGRKNNNFKYGSNIDSDRWDHDVFDMMCNVNDP